MGFNPETGEITNDQHIVRPDQRYRTIGHVVAQEVDVASYAWSFNLAVDCRNALWADSEGVVFSKEEVPEQVDNDVDLVRLFKLPEGIFVENVHAPFTQGSDGEHDDRRLVAHYSFDFNAALWIPVIGVIDTPEVLTQFSTVFFERHHGFIEESVLKPGE